jgi:cation transport ATPase
VVGARGLRRGSIDAGLLTVIAALWAAGLGRPADGALLLVIFGFARALAALAGRRAQDAVRGLESVPQPRPNCTEGEVFAGATKSRRPARLERLARGYTFALVVATAAMIAVPLGLGSETKPTLLRAMAFLIVAAPCAFALATTPPLLAAMANANRHGVVVKDAAAMDRLGRVPEPAAVPAAIRLSRLARRVGRQNLVLAGAAVLVLVTLDLVGTLPLPVAVAAHEGSAVLVAVNGLRLLRAPAWRPGRPDGTVRSALRHLTWRTGLAAAAWAGLVVLAIQSLRRYQ